MRLDLTDSDDESLLPTRRKCLSYPRADKGRVDPAGVCGYNLLVLFVDNWCRQPFHRGSRIAAQPVGGLNAARSDASKLMTDENRPFINSAGCAPGFSGMPGR
jgi:hypothetical protein